MSLFYFSLFYPYCEIASQPIVSKAKMLAAKMSMVKMPDMEMGCQDMGCQQRPGLGVTGRQNSWQKSQGRRMLTG